MQPFSQHVKFNKWRRTVVLRYNNFIFGFTTNPFIRNYIFKYYLEQYQLDVCTEMLKNNFYVDNLQQTSNKVEGMPTLPASENNNTSESAVQPFELPSGRFQTVHVDIAGPLPLVKNPTDPYFSPYRYILTCINRNTRWGEACPISEITAKFVSIAFVDLWISRFGAPLHFVTDKVNQFESELFTELSKIIGFHRLRTTAYHPQTNCLVERAQRTLKIAIKARKDSWLSSLPIVLFGIRITPKESN